MAKEVTFTINKEGEIKIDMEGFEGKGCHELMDHLSSAIGGKITKEVIKDEYYRNNKNQNTITNSK
jgi:hypothetical protein